MQEQSISQAMHEYVQNPYTLTFTYEVRVIESYSYPQIRSSN